MGLGEHDGKEKMKTFDLPGFARHVAALSAAMAVEHRHGLEKAARIIQAEARHMIGNYQDAASPFAGWAELADATKDDRVRRGFSENDPGLRMGKMRDSIGFTVRGNEAVVGSNDDHLVWFELGTSRQPPRSVLGMAVIHQRREASRAIGDQIVTHLAGGGVVAGRLRIT